MTVRPIPAAVAAGAFVLATVHLFGYTVTDVPGSATVAAGLLAFAFAYGALKRYGRTPAPEETPDPERRHPVAVPGDDLGDAVDQFRDERWSRSMASERITDGLRQAALKVMTRFEGLSESEATERIEAGTWTDDSMAAGFLSTTEETPGRSLRDHVDAIFSHRTAFREGVRRTAAAVAEIGYRSGLEGRTVPDTVPQYERERRERIEAATEYGRDDGVVRRERETGHWNGIGVVALLAIGVGAVTETPAVLLTGVVGVGYATYARSTTATVPDLSVERTLSESEPEPGDEVDVTLELANETDRLVPDLRVIDGVPAGLAVADGVARLGTVLRPGETVSLTYSVVARRGTHAFDPAMATVRNASRSTALEFPLEEESTVVCEPPLRPLSSPVPLRTTATTFSGRMTTAEAGSGTEFHSVRDYRRSDPLSRVDWKRKARTGELATLEFHEERAARVLVLIDARRAAYVAPEPDAAHAVDRSVDAAGRIAATLLEDGDPVGLAAIGPVGREADSVVSEPCWLAPSSGRDHRARFRSLLATHSQFSTLPPTDGTALWRFQLRRIRQRLGSETQVVFLTPLCDRGAADIARMLDSRGHPVTVVSPDPTVERTTGQQLARVARRIRRFDLQRAGIPVIDWAPEETIDETFLGIAHGRAIGRGSG